MSAEPYTPAALQFFQTRAIAAGVALELGIREEGDELIFPNGRRRSLTGAGPKVRQPAGQDLAPWAPAGVDGWLLICEGETDCLAAISALYEVEDLADGDGEPELSLSRRSDLPPPLKEATPIAAPGAGVCHEQVAELAAAADVVIAFDGDDAGRKGAEKLKRTIDDSDRPSYQPAGIAHLPDRADLADVLTAAEDPISVLAVLVAEADAAGGEEAGVADGGPEVEPLPPGSITDLLDAVLSYIGRYVVLPGEHERHSLALWVAHTWALHGAHSTPYLLVVSPEKRSGKTRLLEALELLVARPWRLTGASEAAMFRKIAKARPTLELDEIDAVFGSHSDRTEPLRAILNAGNRPGASVARCVGENKDVEDFSVYCPKVLAGIDSGHRIPDTVRDRSVTIRMQRKTTAEPVERFRYRVADAEVRPVREKLERWAAGACDLLLGADPDLPVELDDRAAEAWEPLLAIANMASGEWPMRAREAAAVLSGDDDRDETTTGTLLLGAIRDAFADSDRESTAALLETINGDEELPFGGWRDGKGLDSRRLAKALRPYGVKPRTIRFDDGDTQKGYLREQFSDVWSRWLPTCIEASQASQASQVAEAVTEKPLEQANVTGVTDVAATAGCDATDGVRPATEEQEADIERLEAKFGDAA